MDIKDRINGAFIGLYYGSGINPRISPMMTAKEAVDKFGNKSFDQIDRDYKLYDQHTMTNIIYNLLIRYGKVTPELFKDYLLELHNRDDVFKGDVYGPSTQNAVRKLLANEDIYKLGITGITCGSSMRALPIALYFYNDINKLIENTVNSCVISHNTDIGIESAIATNTTLACLINGKSKIEATNAGINKAQELHKKYGAITTEPEIAKKIRFAVDLVKNKSIDEAINLIQEKIGIGWYARETIPNAYANYTIVDNPKDSSLLSMKCGGDNQTVPEIVCSFLGAEYGDSIFSKEVIKRINTVNNINIYDMANKLMDKINY